MSNHREAGASCFANRRIWPGTVREVPSFRSRLAGPVRVGTGRWAALLADTSPTPSKKQDSVAVTGGGPVPSRAQSIPEVGICLVTETLWALMPAWRTTI
jgi:hypothetical protein